MDEISAVPFYCLMYNYSHTISFLYFWNLKPDDSSFVQPKQVAY